MTSVKGVVFAWLVVACVVARAPEGEAAVTCNQVVTYLSPCISYVSQGGAVPANCCSGVRTLYGMAQTSPDRRSVCKCLKNAVNGISYSPRNVDLAASLPAKCGVNLPYKISPSTNCDTLN